MNNIKILNQEIMPLHALPVFKEETNFVLTREEMEVILNQEYRVSTGGESVKISTSDRILEDEKLLRVKFFILSRFNEYVDNVLQIENCFYVSQSWCAINGKGSSHHLHAHPNTILSCVYYANASHESGGELQLKMHRSRLQEGFYFSYEKKKPNIFNSHLTDIKVKTGDLVIFPGWVDHKSLPNQSDEERVIIGTNYFVTGKLGKHENKDYIEIG
tara:strand:+ start:982 stop:1629 length:648 start_codon:yes stop_codon:yes gene_type:complete